MTWDVLNIIGTMAFAISGTVVATEENYDILGAYILGLTTAFGGGLIRNLLIGVTVDGVWQQDTLFMIAFFAITFAFLLPEKWKKPLKISAVLFDAIGLAAFSIQGANYAVSISAPVIAVVTAAVMTGSGGGVIRDVLAGRRPMIFHSEIYALWAILAGLIIGFDWVSGPYIAYTLFVAIVVLRIASVYYKWNLPHYFTAQKKISEIE
ncbi:Uncharacterized membrane protein YeiH [Alkalibacterium subtropicum]|uniref:Uncharacterized membrane protein YeiH n=1 Tax=Alkalibacterium subtropicum TaxID=753702 RepID=A0A1I1KHV3_9LACT|nr:trimeric intracellular cation channel family protein [Alkalibacterium subtropicum]SFC60574.1 Uncharacterized membrane protein YeiH [Alkalibacterium subtropicum]